MRPSVNCAVCVLVLFLIGCDSLYYTPSGENRVFKEPPASPTVHLDVAGDTIEAWGRTRLGFSIDLKGNFFQEAYVVIDGDEAARVQRVTELEFDTRNYENGPHPFRAVFVVASGAESLAARLEAEKGVVVWEGTIVIDNSQPEPVAMTSAERKDGVLRLSWERVPQGRIGFQKYEVYKSRTVESEGVQIATIRQPGQTFYEDTTFVGGVGAYDVRVRASNKYSSFGRAITYEYSAAELRAPIYGANDQVRLSWAANPFTKAFVGYKLIRRPVSASGFEIVKETSNPTDTTFTATHDLFGARYDYELTTVWPLSVPAYGNLRGERRVTIGNSVEWDASFAHYLPAYDAYLRIDAPSFDTTGRLKRYDANTKTLEAEGDLAPVPDATIDSHGFVVRPDGLMGYRFGAQTIHAYDLKTLDRVATYDLSSFLPADLDLSSKVWVGNDERLFAELAWYSPPTLYIGYAAVAIDLSTMSRIAFYDGTKGGTPLDGEDVRDILHIAPTGNYVTAELSGDQEFAVYEVRADTLHRIGAKPRLRTIPLSSTFPDGDDHFAGYDRSEGTVMIFRYSDLAKTRSFSVDSRLGNVEYDPARNQFGGLIGAEGLEGRYRVYDSEGSVQHDLPVYGAVSFEWTAGTLWSDSLYLDVARSTDPRGRP